LEKGSKIVGLRASAPIYHKLSFTSLCWEWTQAVNLTDGVVKSSFPEKPKRWLKTNMHG
jgi:hypothetical protein